MALIVHNKNINLIQINSNKLNNKLNSKVGKNIPVNNVKFNLMV